MKHRTHLLSALAALTLATPAIAAEPVAPAPQQAEAAFDILPLDIGGALARAVALDNGQDAELTRRLGECLRDHNQFAQSEPETVEDRVWRQARSLECAAAVRRVGQQVAQTAQAEIY